MSKVYYPTCILEVVGLGALTSIDVLTETQATIQHKREDSPRRLHSLYWHQMLELTTTYAHVASSRFNPTNEKCALHITLECKLKQPKGITTSRVGELKVRPFLRNRSPRSPSRHRPVGRVHASPCRQGNEERHGDLHRDSHGPRVRRSESIAAVRACISCCNSCCGGAGPASLRPPGDAAPTHELHENGKKRNIGTLFR